MGRGTVVLRFMLLRGLEVCVCFQSGFVDYKTSQLPSFSPKFRSHRSYSYRRFS